MAHLAIPLTQAMIAAAADELWRAQVIKPDAEPTAVMLAVALMLKAALKNAPRSLVESQDIDPTLVKKLILYGS